MAKKNHIDKNHGMQGSDKIRAKDDLSTAVTYIAVCNDIKERKRYGEYSCLCDCKTGGGAVNFGSRGVSNSGAKIAASIGLAFTFFVVIICFSAAGYFDVEGFGVGVSQNSKPQSGDTSSASVSSTALMTANSDTSEKAENDYERYSIMEDIAFEEMSSIFGASMSNVTDSCSRIYRVPSGVILNGIVSGEAADRCGLNAGDIIIACGSSNVTDVESLYSCLVNFAKTEGAVLFGDDSDGEYPIEYYVYGVPVKTSLYIFRNGKMMILEGEFDVSPIR